MTGYSVQSVRPPLTATSLQKHVQHKCNISGHRETETSLHRVTELVQNWNVQYTRLNIEKMGGNLKVFLTISINLPHICSKQDNFCLNWKILVDEKINIPFVICSETFPLSMSTSRSPKAVHQTHVQGPVVWKGADNAILQIQLLIYLYNANHYPLDSIVGFANNYP